ncbi:MAG: hypothetical protein GC154_11925 [bacterium]|nr:hypothetical protein [bacterium]
MTQPLTAEQSRWIDETLAVMTPRQKAGQLFCPFLMPDRLNAEEQIEEYAIRIRDEIAKYAPGGYYLNRHYIDSTPLLINLMQSHSATPLLIAADMEAGAGGGLNGTIAPGCTLFPPAMAIGAAGKDEYAYLAAYHAAREARALGVNWIFAPVLDVNCNPDNPIVNTRSYGEDPAQVARLARHAVHGYHKGGVIACAKHFPGHGDTSNDSHVELCVIEHDRARLDAVELAPYRALIEDGELAAIMTAHIAAPALDRERRPATVSPRVIGEVLRGELGFDGVVITDAMLMGGITTMYEPAEAAVLALEAGVDLVLMPPDLEAAYDGVFQAIDSGRISEQRVDESIRRILALKARFHLNEGQRADVDAVYELLTSCEGLDVSEAICRDAMTLLSHRDGVFPLQPMNRTAAIALFDTVDEYSDMGEEFFEAIETRANDVEGITLLPESAAEVYQSAREAIDESAAAVFGVVINVMPEKGTVDLPEPMAGLIDEAIASGKPVAIVLFGGPYLASRFPNAAAVLCGYGYFDSMAEAAAEVLYGGRVPAGECPVQIS